MKLDLTIEEINQILNIVSQAPYAQVSQLIVKIQVQANKQVDESGKKGKKGKGDG